ncbi:hypothetical protein MVEN_00901600 [Mycena venus]|uniref:Uncharacterized protein n=1 Tax=Mycena venus TaxID=2733690 RepID=A0A8H6YH75_9AGAR|nr:hypothetical protein MVEN_00901600 [Mycena venus]
MPRPLKVLDDCFIESEDKKQILCSICERHGPEEWIGRDGDKKHLLSKKHERNVEADNIRAAAQAAIQTQNASINSTLERVEIPITEKNSRPKHVPSAEEQEMWYQYQMEVQLSALGMSLRSMDGRWNAASIAWNLGFMGPESEIPILNEHDEEDALLCEMMDNAQINDPATIEDLVDVEINGQTCLKTTAEWYPYPTKMMFLLDTLDNLPHQRVSNSLMKVFLWILREGGARDVPSLDALRKVQVNLHRQGGVPTVPWTSTQGNVFHLNDIRKIIAKDYANPLTRSLLHFYPEIPDGPISEAWHAQKWRREIDRDALTPMIVDGHRHFYVNELARRRDGSFIIPLCWVLFKGEMHADAMIVTVDGDGIAHVDTMEILIRAADLVDNYLDLEFKKLLPSAWDEPSSAAEYPSKMPNPLRKLANGRPMYTSFVDLFFDDVSGNRSKSWNKHYNCYCTHRNLPRRILQQEFHTHFVTTSPHASSSEQFEGIKSHIESTHTDPIPVYDQSTEQEAAVRVFVNTGPSDNPMGSEMTGHIGAKGNRFCRKCKVGGCGEHKQTDVGFHSMFEAGIPRSAAETLTELHEQVELACLGVKAAVEARQTDTGIKDSYTNYWINDLLQRSRELKKADPNLDSAQIVQQLKDWVKQNESTIYNPFLSLKGFDVSQDTPIEILHTILLGIVNKLVFMYLRSNLTKSQNIEFVFNVQHDCYAAKCIASGSRVKKQERVDSNITESFIEHQPSEEHIINTTAFHNAHLLRRCLPRSAWAPVPMFTPEDRLTKHNELAEQLREKHSSKKAEKAAATAAQAAVAADTPLAAEGNAAAMLEGQVGVAASTEQSTAAVGGENGSTIVPAKRKRGRPPKNGTSTAQKGKRRTNGKKDKAANPAKKRKPQEITEDTVAVDSENLADTSSDSASDSSDSDQEHHPRKRRAQEPDSDSDYDGGAGAANEQTEELVGGRRPQRARRAPRRFAMNAYVDSDSD